MIAPNQRDFLINHIIDQLTEFVMTDFQLPLSAALKEVYQSKVYQLLQSNDGNLYTQSPSYIYELLKQEINR
ncbi:MAG: hypothetical protein E7099_06440 [Mediterranea massiliensis]|nr:hypothetical protein [Mediterranea massiliensis]